MSTEKENLEEPGQMGDRSDTDGQAQAQHPDGKDQRQGMRTHREQVLAWARMQVGCAPDDERWQPMMWCSRCRVEVPPEGVTQVRSWWGLGRPGYVCPRCRGPLEFPPF
jgi:hypothetical protein